MAKGRVTGIKVYVLTVDSETNTILKVEEEDPNTGHRTEATEGVPAPSAPFAAAQGAEIPAGFTPSVIIWVGAGATVMQAGAAPGVLAAGESAAILPRQPPPPPRPYSPPTRTVPPPRYPVSPKPPPPPKKTPPPPKKSAKPPKV